MRRLLLLASAMIFLDVAFFAAIAPLLPDYVDELGLSEAEAGILSASYAAGTLLASLPAGFVASRVGPRRTVIFGLLLLGVSSLVFGFVERDRPARRGPLHPGDRRGADLGRGADLADHHLARGEPRHGDRHRARHRRRRRPARAGARRARRPRSGPSRSSARSWSSPWSSPTPPRGCPRRGRRERQGLREVVRDDAEPAGPRRRRSSSPCPR